MINQKKILLVEDDYLIAISEKEILEKYNFKVDIVDSGEKSIEYVNNNPDVDLILMDINLNGKIDGTKAAEIILKDYDIPIIFQSSYTDEETIRKVENITSYGYIVKNVPEQVFITSIKMAFRLYESKKREKEQEEKYKEIFNSTNEAIFIDDASNGKIIDVNETMLKMYGYDSKEEVLKGNIGDLSANIEPYTEDVAQKLIRKSIEEGPQTFEWLAKKKNGEIFWVEVSLKKTEITGKGRILAVVRDISERKKAEKKLEETIQLLSFFIMYSPIYAYIKEVKEGESNVLYASENYIDMVGIPGSKMIGMNMFQLFPEEFAKKMTDDDWYVVSHGKTIKLREDFKNRNYITIKYPIVIYDKKYLAGYTIDITELIKSENEIKQLLREKEIILKEVHHRIKNNINSISSLISLQIYKEKNPDLIQFMNKIKGQIENFKILYEKLYLSEKYNEISIKDYLCSLIDMINNIYSLTNKDIKINTEIIDIILNTKILYPLGIIINELITNSIKYAFIDIENPVILLKVEKKDTKIYIIYYDNGKGIPEHINFNNTTGFGLQLINLLVQQINGNIKIIRENGTKFVIDFDI